MMCHYKLQDDSYIIRPLAYYEVSVAKTFWMCGSHR